MANAAGLINEGLWRKDKEFQKLSRLAQCTFCQVLSWKDLDTAGVLTLHLELLAKACQELTVEQLKADLAELEARRFLFVDYDTDELLIRSYVRLVSVKNRNSWHSVPKNSRMLASEKLRHELAVELRRLGRKDAADLATEIDPVETPSGPGPDVVETPSQPGTPSRPRLDGDSQVQVLVQGSPSVGGSVGGEPPLCNSHLEDPDKPCHKCRRRREWESANADVVERNQLDERRRLREQREARIRACRLCDEFGDITYDDAVAKCTHPEVANG